MKSPEIAPRTDHRPSLYKAAFGDILTDAKVIADVGAGDSQFALGATDGQRIWRIDALYGTNPPKNQERAVAGDVRDLSEIVADETFDAVVSACMMQHLDHNNGDAARAIKEMIRITKEADVSDEDSGCILIYPVFRPKQLAAVLERDFSDIDVRIGYAHLEGPDALYDINAVQKPTLRIHKDSRLTDGNGARIDQLAKVIEQSKALSKRATPATLARRALIQLTGDPVRSRAVRS